MFVYIHTYESRHEADTLHPSGYRPAGQSVCETSWPQRFRSGCTNVPGASGAGHIFSALASPTTYRCDHGGKHRDGFAPEPKQGGYDIRCVVGSTEKGVTVFADTNTLLDVLANREPFVRAARMLWEWSELGAIVGKVSVISFNNIFYIVRKSHGETLARECLSRLRQVFDPVGLDVKTLDRAMDVKIRDFEDAIQYSSAVRSGATFLVTRNPGDFPRGSPIPILTSEMFVAQWRPKLGGG